MKKLIFLLPLCGILLSVAGFAQVQQPDYSNFGFSSARINGRIQVSRFDYNVPSLGATSFGNWSSFPNGCRYDVPGYGASVPFTASSTLTWSSSAALPATWQTGIQVEFDVSTAGTAKVWLCNPTAGSITPAALAINVKALQ